MPSGGSYNALYKPLITSIIIAFININKRLKTLLIIYVPLRVEIVSLFSLLKIKP